MWVSDKPLSSFTSKEDKSRYVQYRQHIKQTNPERYEALKRRQRECMKKLRARRKMERARIDEVPKYQPVFSQAANAFQHGSFTHQHAADGEGRTQMGDHTVYYTPIKSVPLPHFSNQVHDMLLGMNMMGELPHWVWVKTVQEAAKFYLQMFPNKLRDSHIYQRIGRTVFNHYPSIGAPGRRPWSKFIKCLSQKIRHLRYHSQRLREMSQMGNLSMDAVVQNEAGLLLDQNNTSVISSPPRIAHDPESDS